MVQFSDLDAIVRSKEFQEKIQRSLGSSTVALFALLHNHGRERLNPAGTGTVVVIGGRHYILTAAHVWDVLKSALKLGITLIDNRDHKTWIEINTIAATLVQPPGLRWSEWGPDLALLRIPPVLVGGIEAFHVFEDLTAPGKMLNTSCIQFWAVIGTPQELGTFTPHHAAVQIAAAFGDPKYHRRGEHDYYDFEVDITSPSMPKSFGGVSGGGLWRILAYISPETKEVDWVQRLKGVAFFELPGGEGHSTIRCHGPKSLTAATGDKVELDMNTLADAYIRYAKELHDEDAWAREEAEKYVRDDESRGLPLIRLLLSSAESDAIIEPVAAGPLKEFLDAHGQQALARVERVAEHDQRLQLALRRLS